MRALCCFVLFATSVSAQKDGMHTQTFPLKKELIGGDTFVRPNQLEQLNPIGFQNPRTPFEGIDPDEAVGTTAPRQTAKAVLLNEGIPFPPGATAEFNPQSGLISVHNTPENLKHTRLFLESFEPDLPLNVSYLVTVIEAPGEVIRQASAAAVNAQECSSQLSTLITATKQPGSNVRVVGDAFLESESGHRSTFSSVQQHIIPTGITTQSKNGMSLDLDLLGSGLKFEVETGQEEKEISFTLEVNSLPPSTKMLALGHSAKDEAGTFPATSIWQSNLATYLNCESGHTRLVSVTKPQGSRDNNTLWAVFLTVCRQRISNTGQPFASAVELTVPNHQAAVLKKIVFDLPQGFLSFFLKEQTPEYLQRWLESNGLEKVHGASACERDAKLEVINTQENIERIHGILREMRHSLPKTAAFSLNTIQAPADLLRDLTRAHAMHGDHEALWRALEAAVSKGAASYINTTQITTDSGIRSFHHSGSEGTWISEFSINKDEQVSVDFEKHETGSMIELEAWLPEQDEHIQIHLTHDLQTGPMTMVHHAFKQPTSGQSFELPLPAQHTARTTHSFSMTPGGIRLVSICRPTGEVKSDVLWATFISCEVVPHIPSKRTPLFSSTSEQGEIATHKLETRVFKTPQGFFSSASPGWGPITAEAARQALAAAGVSMDPEADVYVSNDSGILRVKATSTCLDQIDAALKKTADHLSQTVVVHAHLFEGPGSYVRSAAQSVGRQADHSGLLSKLQTDAKIGKVKYVTTLRVETKGGVRTQSEQVRQIQQLTGIRPLENEGAEFIMEMCKHGHLLTLEPKIRADEDAAVMEFTLEFGDTDPVQRQEHLIDTHGRKLDFPLIEVPVSKLTSAVTMSPGTARLIWIFRPQDSKDDRLQILFFQYILD